MVRLIFSKYTPNLKLGLISHEVLYKEYYLKINEPTNWSVFYNQNVLKILETKDSLHYFIDKMQRVGG